MLTTLPYPTVASLLEHVLITNMQYIYPQVLTGAHVNILMSIWVLKKSLHVVT